MEPFRSSPSAAGLALVLGSLLPLLVVGQLATTPPSTSTPLPVSTSAVPTTTECPALVQYAQTYRDCETFGNCSGALCHLQQFLTNSNATVWVEEKCADPVLVEMSIDGSSGPLDGFRRRFSVGGDGLHYMSNDTSPIVADYGRNASHLHYRATAFIGGDQAMRLIPDLTVPLFPGTCMCQSMQQIADVLSSVPLSFFFLAIDTSCSARSDCRGVNCNITVPNIGNYFADIMVDPCGETVTFTAFDVSDDQSEFRRVFHDSGSYPFTVGDLNLHGSLIVGMVHHNYSMDLSVKLQTSAVLPVDNTQDILPSHKIILDRSNCSNLTYYYNNGTTGGPTTSPSPITMAPPTQPTNCPDAYVETRTPTNCDLYTNCSAVVCPPLSQNLPESSLAVHEPCADPVMVNLRILGQVSRQYSVGANGSTEVVDNSSVKVVYGRNTTHLHFKAQVSQSVLIPMAQIPLHPHTCMCQSMDAIVNSTNRQGLPTTAGIVITRTCSRRPDCDGVDCTVSVQGVRGNRAHVVIDPCRESVRVVIRNGTSSSAAALFNEVYSDSGEFPLVLPGFPEMSLYVGIVHYNFSMQLSMKLVVPTLSSSDLVLISPQKIILDRSNCSSITYYNTEPTTPRPPITPHSSSGSGGSQPSQAPPNGHSQHQVSLAIVVGVPMGILMLFAVTLLIAIVMVLALWRIRKRRRAYSFQRMTFNELDEDEKE